MISRLEQTSLFKNFFASFNKKEFLDISKASLLFALITFTGTLMTNEDTILVGWMSGFHNAGLYAAAQKVSLFLVLISTVIVSATLPSLSKLIGDREAYERRYSRVWQLLFWIALPLVVGGILLRKEIMILMYGAPFALGAGILGVLLVATLFIFPMVLIVSSAMTLHKHSRLVWVNVVGNIVHIILVYLVIRFFGVMGAAVATTITLGGVLIMMTAQFIKIKLSDMGSWFSKTIPALVIMGVVITLLQAVHLNTIFIILIIPYLSRERRW